MTTSILNLEELKSALAENRIAAMPAASSRSEGIKEAALSGREIARRLAGVLTLAQADELERHINESCEQEND